MRKGKDLAHDLDRLVAASALVAKQEWERTTLGDDQDYEDAREETHVLVREVLNVIEKSMDEDLLERLDSGEYPRVATSYYGVIPRIPTWRGVWPYYSYGSRVVTPRLSTLRRNGDMLDQVIDDFRADIESRLKHARRDDRALTDAELDEALKELRDDLKLVVRRARRREERREERDDHRDNE